MKDHRDEFIVKAEWLHEKGYFKHIPLTELADNLKEIDKMVKKGEMEQKKVPIIIEK